MKTWETRYKGHTIRVENSFVERLFVDGELQVQEVHIEIEGHSRVEFR